MRIGIDMGHTLGSTNYGAIGLKKESEETRAVGKEVIKFLQEMGETVVDLTVDYAPSKTISLRQRVEKANASNLDLVVSIHFNAFNGKLRGSEVFTYKGKKLPQAVRVLENLQKLGLKNNGVKDGSTLYILRKTRAPAMLVEVLYIDNKEDIALYDPKKMAAAIAEGITGKKAQCECRENNLDNIPKILEPSLKDYNYRVYVGGNMCQDKAQRVLSELKSGGYVASIEMIE